MNAIGKVNAVGKNLKYLIINKSVIEKINDKSRIKRNESGNRYLVSSNMRNGFLIQINKLPKKES